MVATTPQAGGYRRGRSLLGGSAVSICEAPTHSRKREREITKNADEERSLRGGIVGGGEVGREEREDDREGQHENANSRNGYV